MIKVALEAGRFKLQIEGFLRKKGLCEIDSPALPDRKYDIAVFCEADGTDVSDFELGILIGNKNKNIPSACNNRDMISCGLSRKDTVTLSSIKENSAELCLQRSICAFGKSLTPAEYKVRFEKSIDPYIILAVATLMILLDDIDCEKGELRI